MKASEAPEKIYLEREKETDRIHHLWGRTPVVSSLYEHIEYTRTDAFIEKACEYWYKYNQDVVKGRVSGFTVDVERFKKYMKGE